MLQPHQLHSYQQRAISLQCSTPDTMLWLDPGLGKTVTTLSSISHLQASGWLGGVLIVAPLRVCRLVWRQEAVKWEHTKNLTFSIIGGTPDQRIRALMAKTNIHLINYENLMWLVTMLETYYIKKGLPLPFDGLVWDEVSKIKDSTSKRATAFKGIVPYFKWRTGLTGTPASNGLKDLFGQYRMVDDGKRLGKTKTPFMTAYFSVNTQSHKVTPLAHAEASLKSAIADITLEMSAADYLKMPEMIVNNVMVELPADVRKQYDALEKDFFTELSQGAEIEVFNAASLTNKLLQFSNGAVYPLAGLPRWERVHDAKLEALEEIIDEMGGKPVLLAYAYRSDAERIMTKFAKLRPINLTECKSEKTLKNAMDRWKSGDCPLMIGHPASMGHGIDGLQDNCNTLVWYGLTWPLDLYEQFNKRIHRQGQKKTVVCHRIMCIDTIDQAQAESLEEKDGIQVSLRKAVKEYRETRNNLT